MEIYAHWLAEAGDQEILHSRPAPDAIPQNLIIGGAAEVGDEIEAFATRVGITDLITWGASSGVAPEIFSESQVRFAREVRPRSR